MTFTNLPRTPRVCFPRPFSHDIPPATTHPVRRLSQTGALDSASHKTFRGHSSSFCSLFNPSSSCHCPTKSLNFPHLQRSIYLSDSGFVRQSTIPSPILQPSRYITATLKETPCSKLGRLGTTRASKASKCRSFPLGQGLLISPILLSLGILKIMNPLQKNKVDISVTLPFCSFIEARTLTLSDTSPSTRKSRSCFGSMASFRTRKTSYRTS